MEDGVIICALEIQENKKMPTQTSANIIEELIIAVYGSRPSPRQQYALLQALHGLVRLAKTEQMRDVKVSAEKAVGNRAGLSSRRETRAILRRIGMNSSTGQCQFEFDKGDGARRE
jgi:hypothetical protein